MISFVTELVLLIAISFETSAYTLPVLTSPPANYNGQLSVSPTTSACDVVKMVNCSNIELTDLGELQTVPSWLPNYSSPTPYYRMSFRGRTKIRSIQSGTFSNVTVKVLDLSRLGIRSLDSRAFGGNPTITEINLNGNCIRSIGSGTFDFPTSSQNVIVDLSSNEIDTLSNTALGGNLITINLSDNRLVHVDVDTFSNVSGTTSLSLASNLLTTVSAFTFQSLNSLKTLSLAQNLLTELDPNSFSNLWNLESLDLSNNRLTNLPENIFYLYLNRNLRVLNLKGNHLAQFDAYFLFNFPIPALTDINFDRNQFSDLRITNSYSYPVISLSLSRNRIIEIPNKFFKDYLSLQCLNLSVNNISEIYGGYSSNGENEGSLAGLTNLKLLNLSSNNIAILNEWALADLTSLETLDMSRNQLRNMTVGVFENCTRLRELLLSDNALQTLPSGLFHNNSALAVIDFSNNSLTVIPRGVFYGLTSLTLLNLSSNSISSLSDSAFYDLTNLTFLDLSNNRLVATPFSPFYFSSQIASDLPIAMNLRSNQLLTIPENWTVFRYFPCLSQLILGNNTISYVTAMGIENNQLPANFSCRSSSSNQLNLDFYNSSVNTIRPFAFVGNLAYRVTKLNVSRNYMLAVVVNMFSGLSGLLDLDLSDNSIQVVENGSFAELRALQRLDLSRNLITGVSVGTFYGLSSLSYLSLANNYKMANNVFWALAGLVSLKQLILDNTNVESFNASDDIPSSLKLTYLSLVGNSRVARIKNAYSVPLGKYLLYLNLSFTGVGDDFMQQDLPAFRQLVELRLNGSWNVTQTFVNSITSSLKVLDLSDCHMLNAESLAALSGTLPSNLSALNLDGTSVVSLNTINADAVATSLTSLSIKNTNNLSDDAWQTIAKLVNLQTLDLDHNSIQSIPNSTFLLMYNLKRLSLASNQLSRLERLTLDGLEQSCEKLNLSNNGIDYIEPEALLRLKRLKVLDLSNNKIISLALPPVMDWLEVLDLQNNELQEFPSGPLQFRAISTLNLRGNQIQSLPEIEIYNDKTNYVDTLSLGLNWLNCFDELHLIGSFGVVDLGGNSLLNSLPQLNVSFISGQTVFIGLLKLDGCNIARIDPYAGRLLTSTVARLFVHDNSLISLSWISTEDQALVELRADVNLISSLPTDILLSDNLESLDISSNRLTTIEFVNFTEPIRLQEIWLDGNPWICDCSLVWLRSSPLFPRIKLPLRAVCNQPPSASGQPIVNYNVSSDCSTSTLISVADASTVPNLPSTSDSQAVSSSSDLVTSSVPKVTSQGHTTIPVTTVSTTFPSSTAVSTALSGATGKISSNAVSTATSTIGPTTSGTQTTLTIKSSSTSSLSSSASVAQSSISSTVSAAASTMTPTTTTTTTTQQVPPTTKSTTSSVSFAPSSSSSSTTASAVVVTDVWPLHGPMAGGTVVTVFGQNVGYMTSQIELHSSVNASSDVIKLLNTNFSRSESLVVLTPTVSDLLPTQAITAMEVVVKFDDGLVIRTGFYYDFRPNPIINDIYPQDQILSGGTTVTFVGTNMDSAEEPVLMVTVVVTRYLPDLQSLATYDSNIAAAVDLSQTNVSVITNVTHHQATEICNNVTEDTTVCKMPAVPLPADFVPSPSQNSSLTDFQSAEIVSAGLSARDVTSSNGRDVATVYVGIVFDGYKRYENMSDANAAIPGVMITFTQPPSITPLGTILLYDPTVESHISIAGKRMDVGCRLKDYFVSVGTGSCVGKNLYSNGLRCQPPLTQPLPNSNHTRFCPQLAAIIVSVGNAGPYFYACVSYVSAQANQRNDNLIVSLAVGIGLSVGIVIFVAVVYASVKCCVSPNRKKLKPVTEEKIDREYSRKLPDDPTGSSGTPSANYLDLVADEDGTFAHSYSRQLPVERIDYSIKGDYIDSGREEPAKGYLELIGDNYYSGQQRQHTQKLTASAAAQAADDSRYPPVDYMELEDDNDDRPTEFELSNLDQHLAAGEYVDLDRPHVSRFSKHFSDANSSTDSTLPINTTDYRLGVKQSRTSLWRNAPVKLTSSSIWMPQSTGTDGPNGSKGPPTVNSAGFRY